MKNLLLLILFTVGTTVALMAQGFYVQPGISLLVPATSEVLGPKNGNVLTPGSEVNGVVSGSYGSGLGLNLNLGYMLSRNFGLDLGVSYVLGSKTLVEEFTDGDSYDRSYATNKRVTVSPAFIVDAGSETLSPFARFGILIPVAGGTKGLRESNNPVMVSQFIPLLFPTATDFEAESLAKGQFTVGFTADFGLRYQVNEKMSVSGAIGYTGLRIHRNSYEVTRAELDLPEGKTDVITLLTQGGAYVYTEYFDEVDAQALATHVAAAGDNYGSEEYPAWEVAQGVGFNTFNTSLGLRFSF